MRGWVDRWMDGRIDGYARTHAAIHHTSIHPSIFGDTTRDKIFHGHVRVDHEQKNWHVVLKWLRAVPRAISQSDINGPARSHSRISPLPHPESRPSPLAAAAAADLVDYNYYYFYDGDDGNDDDDDEDEDDDAPTMSAVLSVAPAPAIIRGACMECRRYVFVSLVLPPPQSARPESTLSSLKTKCDRNVPCAQCVKRGCEAICPCNYSTWLIGGMIARRCLTCTLQLVSEHEVASERYPIHSPWEPFLIVQPLSLDRHSNVEVEQLQKNAASMTSRIRHLEHALAVSQAQLASNAQSGGYSMGRSGPLESGFKPAALNNVFNPATCTSSSVSLIRLSQIIFYLALMLNSVGSITGRSDARRLYLSCQVNRRHLTLWSGTTRILVGCK